MFTSKAIIILFSVFLGGILVNGSIAWSLVNRFTLKTFDEKQKNLGGDSIFQKISEIKKEKSPNFERLIAKTE